MTATSTSSIAEFYTNKSVLVTGATGFLGKALVEKLLRSCSAVMTIYILLRPKKGKCPMQRLKEYLQDKAFEHVIRDKPESISKVVAIQGDISLPNLGICETDQLLLQSNVSVVFNLAANVKFNEKLKQIINVNVLGTKRLMELCYKMKHLEAFIQVSTAYSNCDKQEIDEIVYEMPATAQTITDSIQWLDEKVVDALTPYLLKERPNSYTFTKALAEQLIVELRREIPVSIIWPSIVCSAWKEPYPGWVDNYQGLSSGLILIGKGLIRSIYIKNSSGIDLVPVDIVVNLMLSAAWYTASHRPNKILVYNCTSGNCNRSTWRHLKGDMISFCKKYPSNNVMFYPSSTVFRRNKWLHNINDLIFHRIAPYFIDFFIILICHKPKLVSGYVKIRQLLKQLEFFTSREWSFNNKNVLHLNEILSPQDRIEFNFDTSDLDWVNYFEQYVLGLRHCLLKEDLASLPASRKRLKRVYVYTKLFHAFLLLFLMLILLCLMLPLYLL